MQEITFTLSLPEHIVPSGDLVQRSAQKNILKTLWIEKPHNI
jgi:hypothetical protein